MEVDAREAVLGPKGLQKKRLFGDGGGSGEACPKGGCAKKTKKNQKAKRNPKKQEKKICTTVGWVDALLGGLGSSRLKARVACQKGGLTKKILFSKKRSETQKDKKIRCPT